MKNLKLGLILLALLLAQNWSIAQYAERQDVVWARTVPAGTLTLDGVLNEVAWDNAESMSVVYGEDGALPTSGWRSEYQDFAITDPTHATVKFLVTDDNHLWLSFDIPDSSIGGSKTWARWDGILMSVKDKLDPNTSTTAGAPTEYFYTWWIDGFPFKDTPIVGGGPYFRGGDKVGNNVDSIRTPEQIAAWDARTVVTGTSNDAGRDQGWTVEMKLDMAVVGYDVTKTEGELVVLNFSIWDCDYLFEGNPLTISTTRTHVQNPWNDTGNNVLSIYARPDIDLTANLPGVDPDVVVPYGSAFADPEIDGIPDEAVWQGAYSFNLGWDIETFRTEYPGAGSIMSGHWQPELNLHGFPPVIDPSFANVRMFFKDQYLYVSADVNDLRVQGSTIYDRIDGVRLVLGDRGLQNDDHFMIFKQIRVNFDTDGNPIPLEFLPELLDSSNSSYGVALKGATTVNNNNDFDEGYTIELKIDLNYLGYPADLGDKLIFMGLMLADGDSFEDSLADYGTRAWWFREHEGGSVTVWGVLDPDTPVSVEDQQQTVIPDNLVLYGNYPNPFNPSTTIKFSIPENGNAKIVFFNSIGEEVSSAVLNNMNAGLNEYNLNASSLASGVYFYQIQLNAANTLHSNVGKMLLIK